MPWQSGRVAANWARLSRTCWYCNSGRVLPWLIVLWRSRPVVQPVTQARPMMKLIRASRMDVPKGYERTVYAGYIDDGWAGHENRAILINNKSTASGVRLLKALPFPACI